MIVVLTSLKRGGIMAFSIAILAYLYTSQILLNRKKQTITKLVGLLCIIGIILFLMVYVNDRVGGTLTDRFNSIGEDGGSGRLDIWKNTINLISHTSFPGLLFGHGWDAVYGEIGVSAHNDYLEVIYDFGICGLVLLLSSLSRLIKITAFLVKTKSFYAPAMVFSLSLFLINSLVSHIIIYPHYFILFLLFWSYVIGITNCQKRISNNNLSLYNNY